MNSKNKILIFLITILIFQAIALLIYYFIDENYFVQLFALSIVFSAVGIAIKKN